MRSVVSIILGIIIIILGVATFVFLKSEKEQKSLPPKEKVAIRVKTEAVQLTAIPYIIEATGIVGAKEKVELYSEVQGILVKTRTPFKEGNTFYKGATLLQINNQEYKAQVKSNKSTLMNQIAAMLPDMEIEYPVTALKWKTYLSNFDINTSIQPIPEFTSEAEKLFITGKKIIETYYSIKNQEERLSKYTLRAPFSGSVTQANVQVGTLVRSGQKLGEFIDPSVFEVELSIPASENKYLKKGGTIALSTLDDQDKFKGTVTRINERIDQETQSILVIVQIEGTHIKDGQYVKAHIKGAPIEKGYLLEHALLKENQQVYIVRDGVLALKTITPVNRIGNQIVVQGLQDQDMLIMENIANAYPGMKVQPILIK